ncbi:MAG TPA: ectonucleotide pyrophosphatase/phosphodiesterase [Planctomycetota bacterium]
MIAFLLLLQAEHVVVVSIDGLRPEFYLGDYDAPALKALAARGVSAKEVESVFPSTTYPSHATIVTGVRPWKHGVTANTTWSESGGTRDWHWHARDLKARTLWQAARAKSLKVALTYWPSSVGADVDWILGEIWDPEPKGTLDRLRAAATPGLLAEVCGAVGIPEAEMATDKAAIDRFTARAAAYVFRTKQPHLQLVHFLGVDEAQHKHGRDGARDALKLQDEHLARVLAAVNDKTLVIVLGDHGFLDVHRNINPNALLRDEGWVTVKDGQASAWRALGRSSGGSMAVYVKDAKDVAAVRDLLRARAEGMYDVLERAELDGMGYDPAAALALDPRDGWAFSGAFTARFVEGTPTVKGNHGQRPTRPGLATGFVAAGPGVKPGTSIARMRLVDVAPTVAKVLGLELGDVEGVPLPFTPETPRTPR